MNPYNQHSHCTRYNFECLVNNENELLQILHLVGCPPQRIWETECQAEFRYRHTDTYDLIDETCVLRRRTKRIRCACPSPVSRTRCDGRGQLVKCNVQFQLDRDSNSCRPIRHCWRRRPGCAVPEKRVVSKCSPETGFKQQVELMHFERDPTTCECQPTVVKRWTEYCGENCHTQLIIHCQYSSAFPMEALFHKFAFCPCIFKQLHQPAF